MHSFHCAATFLGFKINSLQNSVVEVAITYDGIGIADPICGINDTYNANRTCLLTFTIPEDLEPPVLVYYQLTNFHQNYRKYSQSLDPYQLYGRVGGQDSVSAKNCEPLNMLGNITLNPCGVIANTFFNDYFTLIDGFASDGEPLYLDEQGIAWQSDINFRYGQPDGFMSEPCPSGDCSEACCAGGNWSCTTPYRDPATGECFRFFYPDDETTQYLYETYPDIISPLEGVTNEHFIVWMKIAPLPTFRKLYGWFNHSISKGETLTFRVNANYAVTSFGGSKALIVTNNNIFGGRNPNTAPFFIGVGAGCLGAGLFFLLKHLLFPRKLADKRYLRFKQD